MLVLESGRVSARERLGRPQGSLDLQGLSHQLPSSHKSNLKERMLESSVEF